MKLLFSFLSFLLVKYKTVKLLDVLKSVHDEWGQSKAVKYLIIVDFESVYSVEALDFWKKDEAAQVVVR